MTAQGWHTSDAQELEVRRLRARAEPMALRKLTPGHAIFADFSVCREDQDHPQTYIVEIRSLTERSNYCTCPDFIKNSLGTCKHIEKVVMKLEERLGSKPRPSRSPFAEVFMGRTADYKPQVIAPVDASPEVTEFLRKYLNALGEFKVPWQTTLQVFLRDLRDVSHTVANLIRVSREVYDLAEEIQRRQELAAARQRFEQEVLDGERSLQMLRHKLYDYQVKGMMHLAFTGRAMLGDEMGLGKTVQAIAACHIMRELWGIRRCLIVCPASLKAEWDEQVRKFTALPIAIVDGTPDERRRLYERTDAFFLVVHYEQVLRDEDAINRLLRPDLIILDEAQRIKNWQTQTAQSIKRLDSQFAFVLTGTPLENRIDEVYSLVEFINPRIFGSLFRFNRDFYEVDEQGKVTGYKNLRELHERLRPIMVRRRKRDIADELPPRVDNTYFVPLSTEQRQRYAAAEQQAAVLINQARQQPLRRDQYDLLQRHLACMRMLCDSVYILDQSQREAPKVDELFNILDDLWDGQATRKVLVFSEWERMLELVRQRLERAGQAYAWFTGSVPVDRRAAEVERFRSDEACRIMLMTDAGGLGLNLQVASVVVNLDLPWNPARLEQRVARAWRTHQRRNVSVINMIAEGTIEHRMLATLDLKQALANGVLDGEGDLEDLDLPSGRAAFLQRLEAVVDTRLASPPPVAPESAAPARRVSARPGLPPAETFRQELTVALGGRLQLFRAHIGAHRGVDRGLVVVDGEVDTARHTVAELVAKTHGVEWRPELHVLGRDEYSLVQRLAQGGLLTLNDSELQELYRAEAFGQPAPGKAAQRRRFADPLLARAERQARMAACLEQGGFASEAAEAMREAVDLAARALAVICLDEPLTREPETFSPSWLPAIRQQPTLTPDQLRLLESYRSIDLSTPEAASVFLATARTLLERAQELLVRLSL